MEQGGAFLCTTHMPSYPHATLACIVAGRHNPREKRRSAGAQDGAGMCTTPMPHLLTQPLNAWPTKVVHIRTHQLRRRKQDTGGKRVVGDVTQKRKDD